MRNPFRSLAVVTALSMATVLPAWASATPLNIGDSVALNFQVGGFGGPYVTTNLANSGMTASNASVTFFDGFDLSGTEIGTSDFTGFFSLGSTAAGSDGTFSVRITALQAFDLLGVTVVMSDRFGAANAVTGTLVSAVPEPSALALAGIALLALGATRHRHS